MHIIAKVDNVDQGAATAIIAGTAYTATPGNPQYWTVTIPSGSTLNVIETAISNAIKDAMSGRGEPLSPGDKIMLFGSCVVL